MKRQKDKKRQQRTKRQRPKIKFNTVMSGQFLTLAEKKFAALLANSSTGMITQEQEQSQIINSNNFIF